MFELLYVNKQVLYLHLHIGDKDTTNKDNYSMKTETNNKDCFVSLGVEADSGHKCMFTHDLLKSFPGM